MEKRVNKGGRPPKPDYKKRSHTVTVRFSAAEYGIVQSRAKRANLEMTNYLRAAAATGVPYAYMDVTDARGTADL